MRRDGDAAGRSKQRDHSHDESLKIEGRARGPIMNGLFCGRALTTCNLHYV